MVHLKYDGIWRTTKLSQVGNGLSVSVVEYLQQALPKKKFRPKAVIFDWA